MKKNQTNQKISVFSKDFRDDLYFWTKTDRKTALKILDIVDAVLRDPFDGLGKPEPLKYLGVGVWSRRITQEHRLVYIVKENRITFIQCRYHY